ncbi:hypothetical protein [Actinotalea sp.]|uniref:hypothetical protein n=1 Tax=Actinotalea sp. TaxID=1872145 RepID=UPI002CCAEEE9|nr:hypothetical protein [Actinotalea sp.]HQY32548.1 hypothetical protein [Actinotalea sp.]HRA50128.1 hypothetical protein [Actinotalea sp.]
MSPVVVPVVVALLAAIVVLAAVARDGGSSRGLLSDLRSGLRRGDSTRLGLFAGARRDLVEAADVETSHVEEIFLLGGAQEDGYVRADDLTDPVARVTQAAARGVTGLVRR